jgi:hypothetical protein
MSIEDVPVYVVNERVCPSCEKSSDNVGLVMGDSGQAVTWCACGTVWVTNVAERDRTIVHNFRKNM